MSPVNSSPKIYVLLPAAGSGRRMASELPKQYLKLSGKSIIENTLCFFLAQPGIERLYLGLARDDREWDALDFPHKENISRFVGGSERHHTVLAGLQAMESEVRMEDWVLVHDVARPCLSADDLEKLITELYDHPIGGILAAPVADTLKRGVEVATGRVEIAETISREGLWRAFTPQMFRYGVLRQALQQVVDAGRQVTDEASAIEAFGQVPLLVSGSSQNIKVTLPEDMTLAEKILQQPATAGLRIGNGYDVHAFEEGDHVIIGGVRIPHQSGLKAHSDGDVLLHALCDALLGAAALGDIGRHFPDTDPQWSGVDSRVLLRAVLELLHERGYAVVNVDTTIIAQAPKMAPHIEQIRTHIAADLALNLDAVGVKATTTEGLGFTGREEGIACMASCLLSRQVSGPLSTQESGKNTVD